MSSGQRKAQAADQIAAELRRRITAGLLPPGTSVRDAAFAHEFGVSRNTMREAVRLLRHDGLLEHRVNAGAYVPTLTPADVGDIYAARRCVEVQAVRESAVADSAGLAAVGRAVELAEEAVATRDWGRVGTASLGFHQALVALLGSSSLDTFFAGVVARLRLAFAMMDDEGAFQRPWVPRDRQIWDGLRAGRRDDAEAYLRLYLDESQRRVLDVVRAAQHDTAVPTTGRPPKTAGLTSSTERS